MTELVFKMPTRNRHVTGSDSTSEGDVGRYKKDSSTASQHSTDETHDLPPIVGAPNSTVASRYAVPPDSQQNGGPGQKENHPGGMLPHNIRSNSLYESHQGSPSLRRRLKVLIRQKSEPDMLMGRDLGLNSPRMRRMIAPSPPPGDSPRSQGGSDCNSPRIIRKPRSFHGHGSSPRTPKSAENSPMILRRSVSTVSQSPISNLPTGSETIDGMRQARSHSTGSRTDASSISANPAAPGSPFTMRREVNLRKASGSRLENPNQTDFLPAVNGNSDGCATHPITSQESRRSFASDDDSAGFMSMETVQSSIFEHVAPDDRYGHSRGPHSMRKQQPPNQLQHDPHHYQLQEGYHHHHHHHQQHQSPPHPHPPHQMPNGTSWGERNSYADCSPPPTNSPTRELENQENMRESFNSSYSSGSAERLKFEEVSNEDKRRDNSLYDIEEAREQTDDVPDDKEESDCNNGGKVKQDNAEFDSERTPERKDNENDNTVQPPAVDEGNNNENGNVDAKANHPIKNGENSNDSDEESGDEGDDYSDDSYEDTVPEYQKAPMSTKLRVKNWLAGLEKADNESSSRIDRFLPEII